MRRQERGGKKEKTQSKEDLSRVLSLMNSKKTEIEASQATIARLAAETESAVLAREKAIELKQEARKEFEKVDAQRVEKIHQLDILDHKILEAKQKLESVFSDIEKARGEERNILKGQSVIVEKVKAELLELSKKSNSELSSLEEKKHAARESINNLAKQKTDIESAISLLHQKELDKQKFIEFLAQRIVSLNESIERLWADFEDNQNKVAESTKVVNQIENTIKSKQDELFDLKNKIDAALDELETTRLAIAAVIEKKENIEEKEEKLALIFKNLGLALKL